MPRPRQPLGRYNPALNSGQAGVTFLGDMAGQVVQQTFVVGSQPAGGLNIVQHSLNTTNVIWWWVPVQTQSAALGQSSQFLATPYEASAPSATQILLGFRSVDASMSQNTAGNIYGRLHIMQLA